MTETSQAIGQREINEQKGQLYKYPCLGTTALFEFLASRTLERDGLFTVYLAG